MLKYFQQNSTFITFILASRKLMNEDKEDATPSKISTNINSNEGNSDDRDNGDSCNIPEVGELPIQSIATSNYDKLKIHHAHQRSKVHQLPKLSKLGVDGSKQNSILSEKRPNHPNSSLKRNRPSEQPARIQDNIIGQDGCLIEYIF